jgi:MFS family permease
VTVPEQSATSASGIRGGVVERIAPGALGRDFRWLWGASLATNLGDGALLAAGPLLVTTITREPFAIAASVFLQQLPWVLIGIPAGAFIDRHDRRRLSILVNLLRTLVLTGLALTIATGTVSLPVIFVAVFLIGTAETFADNAGGALMATTVPKAGLGVANARLSGTNIVANQLVGPPIGAFLFALAMAVPFALDAVCALAGAVLVSRIAARPVPAVAPEDRHLRREIADGMRWLWRHPPVRALFLTILLFNVTFGAAMSVYVLLAKERLGLDDVGYGVLITVGAIGGLIGSAAYGSLERRFSLATLMRIGLGLETVTHLVLATTTSVLVAAATMTLFGIHEVVWGTTSTTVRQRAVPSRLLGRVTSVYMLGVFGGTVVGGLIGGVIAQLWGVTAPFWFAFIGSAALLAVIWRTLDDIAHAPAAEEQPLTT